MIKLTTPCDGCVHEQVCRYKNMARITADKLKVLMCDDDDDDIIPLENMSTNKRFDIHLTCNDFLRKGRTIG